MNNTFSIVSASFKDPFVVSLLLFSYSPPCTLHGPTIEEVCQIAHSFEKKKKKTSAGSSRQNVAEGAHRVVLARVRVVVQRVPAEQYITLHNR